MEPLQGPVNPVPPSLPPVERRRSPRCAYCTAASLRSIRDETSGTVLDISADGMFILTETLYFEGEFLDLTFTYRSARWTQRLQVEVVRTLPSGIGVRIVDF